jgi:hypothetical protein
LFTPQDNRYSRQRPLCTPRKDDTMTTPTAALLEAAPDEDKLRDTSLKISRACDVARNVAGVLAKHARLYDPAGDLDDLEWHCVKVRGVMRWADDELSDAIQKLNSVINDLGKPNHELGKPNHERS